MLHEFLATNRNELVARCRAKVRQRSPEAEQLELEHGVTPFLDQLVRTLRLEQISEFGQSVKLSGPAGGDPAHSELGDTAIAHGRELLANGYAIEQVVHDYGDLCQAITDLAFERKITIDTDEFRTLNRCLDNAIAFAVAEFAREDNPSPAAQQTEDSKHRLGALAHDMRNLLTTATLAVRMIKTGNVGLTGATGQMLDRSLSGLVALIDMALIEVRSSSGPQARPA